jgi:hypothetical protein
VNIGASLPDRSGYSMSDASRASEQSLVVLMESRMRWKSQVRFGGRRRGDHRPQGRHRRLAADPTRRPLSLLHKGSSEPEPDRRPAGDWTSSDAQASKATPETLARPPQGAVSEHASPCFSWPGATSALALRLVWTLVVLRLAADRVVDLAHPLPESTSGSTSPPGLRAERPRVRARPDPRRPGADGLPLRRFEMSARTVPAWAGSRPPKRGTTTPSSVQDGGQV